MDINYFINILQQNTETIKQLKEEIELLKEENKQQKEFNDCLKIENNELKSNLNDVIDSLLNECNHTTEYAKRLTYTFAIFDNNATTKQHQQDNEDFVDFCNINKCKKLKTYKIFFNTDDEIFNTDDESEMNDCYMQVNYYDVLYLMKQDAPYKTITTLEICDNLYSKSSEFVSNICDACRMCYKTTITARYHKFDIDFLTYFPNLETLIVHGYGICGLLSCLTNTNHLIIEIKFVDYYLTSTEGVLKQNKEINEIDDYCKANNIKFSSTYTKENIIYDTTICGYCNKKPIKDMICINILD